MNKIDLKSVIFSSLHYIIKINKEKVNIFIVIDCSCVLHGFGTFHIIYDGNECYANKLRRLPIIYHSRRYRRTETRVN